MADDKAWRAKQAAAFHRGRADERRREQHRDEDRARLAANFARKLMTTGVGALAAFEAAFGHLWGDGGTPEGDPEGAAPEGATLAESRKQFRALYQRVRDEVFDLISQQTRGAQAEVSLHRVEYDGHRARLDMRPRDDGRDDGRDNNPDGDSN